MDVPMKAVFAGLVASLALTSAGCGYLQQSKFQNSFLPPAPHPASPVLDIVPPAVGHPNPFLKDIPPVLLAQPLPPRARTKGDASAQKALEAFNRGKSLYLRNDMASARAEFDAAIDWMIEAATEDPASRDEYCNQMDDMVEQIHRYDLQGLGASATLEQGKFEKAPLED